MDTRSHSCSIITIIEIFRTVPLRTCQPSLLPRWKLPVLNLLAFLIICVLSARYQTTFTAIFYNCYYYTPYLLFSQYARFKLSSSSTLRTAIYSTIESPCALNPLSPVL